MFLHFQLVFEPIDYSIILQVIWKTSELLLTLAKIL